MRTGSHKSSRQTGPNGAEEAFAYAVIAFLIVITGLPCVIIGLIIQRISSRIWPSWSFFFWFLLLIPSGYALYSLYTYGLDALLVKEWVDYVHTIEQHQFHLAAWNVPRLWAETWPVGAPGSRTLGRIPARVFRGSTRWTNIGTTSAPGRSSSSSYRTTETVRQKACLPPGASS